MKQQFTSAEVFPPGEFLREELEARGWSQADFAEIIGRDPALVSEIISAKRIITPDTACAISEALGTSAQVWLNIESEYRLYQAEANRNHSGSIAKRAGLFAKYPVREMTKRGWIKKPPTVEELEKTLDAFFSQPLPYAARRAEDESKEPLQLAWIYRTLHVSRKIQAEKYSEIGLARALDQLKRILPYPDEISSVPHILREAGVRFLLVEALAASKIDGVCFWDKGTPVIAVSLRYDRIDHFWFTLMHELHHVKYQHGMQQAMLDTGLYEHDDSISAEEKMADVGAEEFLVPKKEFENFVARVQPLFTTMQVQGFSRRIGVHPGVVVGRLQYEGFIDYRQHRRMLIKVRDRATATSIYDGWGMVA